MSKSIFSPLRIVLLAVFAAALATPNPAQAAGQVFLKISGVFLTNQSTARVIGGVSVIGTVSGHRSTYAVEVNVNNTVAKQKITLTGGKSGKAIIDNLLPGVNGFDQKATGKYKNNGGKLKITAPLPAPNSGTMQILFSNGAFGTTVLFTSKLTFTNGNPPIFMTVVASPAQ